MSNGTIERVVELISQRRIQVLEANGLSNSPEDSNNIQYTWINGIYDDIIELIKTAS